jgi:hypothetical protein
MNGALYSFNKKSCSCTQFIKPAGLQLAYILCLEVTDGQAGFCGSHVIHVCRIVFIFDAVQKVKLASE